MVGLNIIAIFHTVILSFFSHVDDDGKCVKGRLDSNGKLEWVKYPCSDVSGGGVICARRNSWGEIPQCYAQPPEEANIGTYETIPEPELTQDPINFCREICKDGSRYFDIKTTGMAKVCHCLDNPIPLGKDKLNNLKRDS